MSLSAAWAWPTTLFAQDSTYQDTFDKLLFEPPPPKPVIPVAPPPPIAYSLSSFSLQLLPAWSPLPSAELEEARRQMAESDKKTTVEAGFRITSPDVAGSLMIWVIDTGGQIADSEQAEYVKTFEKKFAASVQSTSSSSTFDAAGHTFSIDATKTISGSGAARYICRGYFGSNRLVLLVGCSLQATYDKFAAEFNQVTSSFHFKEGEDYDPSKASHSFSVKDWTTINFTDKRLIAALIVAILGLAGAVFRYFTA